MGDGAAERRNEDARRRDSGGFVGWEAQRTWVSEPLLLSVVVMERAAVITNLRSRWWCEVRGGRGLRIWLSLFAWLIRRLTHGSTVGIKSIETTANATRRMMIVNGFFDLAYTSRQRSTWREREG